MSALARLVRLAASAVVTGLVIGGCAPRPEPEAGGEPAEGNAGAADSGAADSGAADSGAAPSASVDLPGHLTLTLTVSEVAAGEPIEFTLGLANVNASSGAEEAVVDFPDGQRFDFEVFQEGASLWRWASDLFFPQMLGRERIAAGESMEWSGRLEEGLPAGQYTVRATLTTSARPTVELEFTIEG